MWRKAGWLLIGLLAPELVLYVALEQRRAALRLTKEMLAIFEQTPEQRWWNRTRCLKRRKKIPQGPQGLEDGPEGKPQARQHQWTHIHSFYFIMGGFAFDTSQANPNFLPNGRSRLTLNVEGLKYIAKHSPSLIPDLPADDIRDKSKADGLGKLLVCLQALWFALQCIGRVSQKTAISFLELNTSAHAICTLLIYLLWWHKPLNIDVPNLLKGEEAWEICALMCVTSNGESNGEHYWNTHVSQFLWLLGFLHYFSAHDEHERGTELSWGQKYGDRLFTKWSDVFNGKHFARLRQHRFEPRMILRWDPVPSPINNCEPRIDAPPIVLQDSEMQDQSLPGESFMIRKGQSLFGFRCMDVYTLVDWHMTTRELHYEERTITRNNKLNPKSSSFERQCTLNPSDLRRWSLCSRAWQKYQPPPEIHNRSGSPELYNGACDRMSNWPGLYSPTGYINDFYTKLLVASVTTGLYGGLHLLAWNAPFASLIEQCLWRGSSALIASSGLLLVGCVATDTFAMLVNYSREKKYGSKFWKWACLEYTPDLLVGMFGGLLRLALLAYIPARIFLLVECGLQMARLPPSAYELPTWSQYYPHIS
ncbi:hypothetical protein MMC11_008535 [Xylographa trunciseda]|nr:hypothetical protein [Xylographa trunciseda]